MANVRTVSKDFISQICMQNLLKLRVDANKPVLQYFASKPVKVNVQYCPFVDWTGSLPCISSNIFN